MPVNINLKQILPSDPQDVFVDKITYNFNRLKELGIGEQGELGPVGPPGPAIIGPQGDQGVRGSRIYDGVGHPDTGIDPSIDLVELDQYIDTDAGQFYSYDPGTSPNWTPTLDIRDIVIQEVQTISQVALIRNSEDFFDSDDRFIGFTNKTTQTSIGGDAVNDILYLSNFQIPTSVTDPKYINNVTDPDELFDNLLSIYVDHRVGSPYSERKPLIIGSVYNDTIFGSGSKITEADESLKIWQEQVVAGSEYVSVARINLGPNSDTDPSGIEHDSLFEWTTTLVDSIAYEQPLHMYFGSDVALDTQTNDPVFVDYNGLTLDWGSTLIGLGMYASGTNRKQSVLKYTSKKFFIESSHHGEAVMSIDDSKYWDLRGDSFTLTDNAVNGSDKAFNLNMYHHSNSSEDNITLMNVYSDSSDTLMEIGGGDLSENAVTEIRIYTGTDNVQSPGSERIRVQSDGKVIIFEDLEVRGTTTTVDSENVTIADELLILNYDDTSPAVAPPGSLLAGIQIDRGTETSYQMVFEENSDLFKVGEDGDLQAVATRQDSPVDFGIPYWSDSNSMFLTSSDITYDTGQNRIFFGGFDGGMETDNGGYMTLQTGNGYFSGTPQPAGQFFVFTGVGQPGAIDQAYTPSDGGDMLFATGSGALGSGSSVPGPSVTDGSDAGSVTFGTGSGGAGGDDGGFTSGGGDGGRGGDFIIELGSGGYAGGAGTGYAGSGGDGGSFSFKGGDGRDGSFVFSVSGVSNGGQGGSFTVVGGDGGEGDSDSFGVSNPGDGGSIYLLGGVGGTNVGSTPVDGDAGNIYLAYDGSTSRGFIYAERPLRNLSGYVVFRDDIQFGEVVSGGLANHYIVGASGANDMAGIEIGIKGYTATGTNGWYGGDVLIESGATTAATATFTGGGASSGNIVIRSAQDTQGQSYTFYSGDIDVYSSNSAAKSGNVSISTGDTSSGSPTNSAPTGEITLDTGDPGTPGPYGGAGGDAGDITITTGNGSGGGNAPSPLAPNGDGGDGGDIILVSGTGGSPGTGGTGGTSGKQGLTVIGNPSTTPASAARDTNDVAYVDGDVEMTGVIKDTWSWYVPPSSGFGHNFTMDRSVRFIRVQGTLTADYSSGTIVINLGNHEIQNVEVAIVVYYSIERTVGNVGACYIKFKDGSGGDIFSADVSSTGAMSGMGMLVWNGTVWRTGNL